MSLTRNVIALGLSFIFCSLNGSIDLHQATAQEKPKTSPALQATVRVIGLEIHKPLPKRLKELKPPDRSGVVVHLLIHCKNRTIIEVADDSSVLTSFVDDKGTNLLKPDKGEPITPGRSIRRGAGFLKFNSTGYCALRIESPVMPAPGARKLMLKGRIGCELGTDLVTGEWTLRSIERKGEKAIGPLSLSESKDQVAITDDKPNRIKGVFFLDRKNAKTKAIPSSTGWSGGETTPGDAKSRWQSFSSDYDLDAKYIRVGIEYYAKHETVGVPFDLEIGLGLR